MDYKAKLEAYINLCTPSFLIKMKTTNDKSYFFKAYKSDYHKDSTVLKFTIADVDPVDEDYERWREINLLTEFGDNFNSLKEVIIPEHKDMYKDIETEGMMVACSVQDKCSGDKLQPPPPPAPANPTTKPETKTLKPPGVMARLRKHKDGEPGLPNPNITPEEVKQKAASLTQQSSEEFEDLSSDEKFVDPTSMYGHAGGRKKKKKRRKKRSRSKKRRNKRKNRTKKN